MAAVRVRNQRASKRRSGCNAQDLLQFGGMAEKHAVHALRSCNAPAPDLRTPPESVKTHDRPGSLQDGGGDIEWPSTSVRQHDNTLTRRSFMSTVLSLSAPSALLRSEEPAVPQQRGADAHSRRLRTAGPRWLRSM